MRRPYIAVMILLVCTAVPTGCKGPSNPAEGGTTPSSGANGTGPPVSAKPPSAPSESAAAANSASRPPTFLSGTYIISEVHKNGAVTMINHDDSTEISFKPDAGVSNTSGTFDRKSRKGGKVDHTDSGQYLIEGTDAIALNILVSRRKIVSNPVHKKYKYKISEDGQEIRLETEDGNTAVFRKIAKTEQ